jgi:hypothetical protein
MQDSLLVVGNKAETVSGWKKRPIDGSVRLREG